MDSGELIDLFYNRAYEKFVDKQILDDKNYIVPRQQLKNYVHESVNIPFIYFIDYIKNNRNTERIEISDITIFRHFSACEIEMCNALIWANNPGCQYIDIGRLFPKYNISKSDSTYKRYGESHIKAATQLGLTFEYYDYWYLSCLGYIYPDLDVNIRKKLLARTITRNRLYQQMLIDIMNHDVEPERYMCMFPNIIVKRRLRNVCSFLEICLKECNNEDIKTFNIKKNYEIDHDSQKLSIPLWVSPKLYTYLTEMNCRTLPREYTIDLIKSYREGHVKACDLLVRSNMNLVFNVARIYKENGVMFDDLIQEGVFGLIKAIEHFNENINVEFGRYAQWWIRRTIIQAHTTLPRTVKLSPNLLNYHSKVWNYINKYEQQQGIPPSVEEINIFDLDREWINYVYNLPSNTKDLISIVEDLDAFESNTSAIERFEEVDYNKYKANALLNSLTKRERSIVKSYFGIGCSPKSLEEIGIDIDLTRERVRQILTKTMKILRERAKKHVIIDIINESAPRRIVESLTEAVIGAYVEVPGSVQLAKIIDIKKSAGVIKKIVLRMEDGSIYYGSPSDGTLVPASGKRGRRTSPEREAFIKAMYGTQTETNATMSIQHMTKEYSIQTSSESETFLSEMEAQRQKSIESLSRFHTPQKEPKESKLYECDSIEENTSQSSLAEPLYGDRRTHLSIQYKGETTKQEASKSETSHKFSLSTNLDELVRLKIITRKECQHCNKKKLRTIGDVDNIIKKKHLTPDSTRFTQYTLRIWFRIIGLLDNISVPKDDTVNTQENLFSNSLTDVYAKYTQRILEIRQARVHGKVILAKPILLLALIEGIEDSIFTRNCFELNEWLEKRYHRLMMAYTQSTLYNYSDITSISKPFWHLASDGFWHLKYSDAYLRKGSSPTLHWLKTNVKYAYLDQELWDLLQSGTWRKKVYGFIIEHKLKDQIYA